MVHRFVRYLMDPESLSRGRFFSPSSPILRCASALPTCVHSPDCPPHVRVYSHDPSNAVSDLDVSQFNSHLFKGFTSGIASILAIHLNHLGECLSNIGQQLTSRVSPCELTPGTSSIHPIHHGPSCRITAVYPVGSILNSPKKVQPTLL